MQNIPTFLYNKLCGQYGEELTNKIIEGYAQKRLVTLRVNTLKVTLEDAIKADQIFSILMGEDVAPRREFIEQNAKYVQNLDV